MAGRVVTLPVSATALETLLRERADIRRGGEVSAAAFATLPSGFAPLDAVLPGGGWPRGAVTELLVAATGIGELSLMLPTLRALTAEEGRDVALVAPPYVPFALTLASAGVVLERLLVVDPPSDGEALWASERLLESGRYATVLLWVRRTTPAQASAWSTEAPTPRPIIHRSRCDSRSPRPGGALRIKLIKMRHGVPRTICLDAALFDDAQGIPWPIVAAATRRCPSGVLPLAARRPGAASG